MQVLPLGPENFRPNPYFIQGSCLEFTLLDFLRDPSALSDFPPVEGLELTLEFEEHFQPSILGFKVGAKNQWVVTVRLASELTAEFFYRKFMDPYENFYDCFKLTMIDGRVYNHDWRDDQLPDSVTSAQLFRAWIINTITGWLDGR